eukprot:TRINITY_DN77142_c0_g1_i1.p1 TRINITY_DN77142_c0_g1~~TRINITY_DN77142_c0_g1_i1.p1  ORF type:complete len:340 (+),score=63.21 TRINITY_DN77142_c0_g1_i1:61-1080(+)
MPQGQTQNNEPIESRVPPVMKRSMMAPHGPQLSPMCDQEDEWQEFCERTDSAKVHNLGRYWWTYGRDEDEDGFLREAVFLEVALRKDVEAKHVRAKLTTRHLTITVNDEALLDEDFASSKWLNVDESFWEINVKEINCVKRKVIRYALYVLVECPQCVTRWLFACEKQEDDGRLVDEDEEEDSIDARLRLIGRMKEPEPRRDADIWFSDTEEEDDRWCDGCGSTRVVIMKSPTDATYTKHCSDCPFVSAAKSPDLPSGLHKQQKRDERRDRKTRLRARKAEARRRLDEERQRAAGPPNRSEEVPEDYKKEEKTRVFADDRFLDEVVKAVGRRDVSWEES